MYTAPCAAWHTPVFLLNSRLGRLSAACWSIHREGAYLGRHPFFRSYGIIMPSSLTTFHSFTLGYSPRPPVSVYGTDVVCTPERRFSCVSTPRHSIGLSASSCHQVSAEAYALRRSSTKPLPLRSTVPTSVKRTYGGVGIFAHCPSATPLGPRLRVRLTLR